MAPAIMLMFLLPNLCQAQTYLNSTGVPTFATISKVENGFVNLGNGNLHLEIDLGTFPAKGKGEAGGQTRIRQPYLAGR
jgi:hypothetical protein